MKRHAVMVIGVVWVAWLIPATGRSDEAPKAARRPGVIFLYTDDQARWAVGAYGNPEVKTSNLDRLAREGAVFRNAFTVTPVCSPSRVALMTGRYPCRYGIEDWINPTNEPDLGLAPEAVLWPEVLKAQGYATALFGKWHLGTRDQFHPTRQGFDTFYGFRDGSNRPIDPKLEVDGKVRDLKGSLPDILVDRALEFLETHKDGPFLVSIHFREPHAPYAPTTPEDERALATLDPTVPDVADLPRDRVKTLTRQYYASVHSVDRNVGRLLDALRRLGLDRDTLVVMTSDHGYMIGQHGLWHKGNATWLAGGKKGSRPNMFDDSVRVPLLLRWPARIRAGTVVDRVVSNLDLYPTFLDLLKIDAPEARRNLDGRSALPLLDDPDGPAAKGWDDTLFGLYDMHHGQVARMRMLRTPAWKLVRHFEPGGVDELYDLRSDPGETHDLAVDAGQRERRAELERELTRRMAAAGDPLAQSPSAGRP